jgi:hypothetical protein
MPTSHAFVKFPNSIVCGRAKVPFWAKSLGVFKAVKTRMTSGADQASAATVMAT